MEKNNQKNPTAKTLGRKNSNRIHANDGGSDSSSYTDRQHHHGDRHRRHSRHQHHHRRHSYSTYSTCSTCSDSSYDAFHSDVGFHHHYQHQYSEPIHKSTTPRTHKARTPSPPRIHRSTHRTTGMGTERSTKITRDSGMTTGFEKVPSMFILLIT